MEISKARANLKTAAVAVAVAAASVFGTVATQDVTPPAFTTEQVHSTLGRINPQSTVAEVSRFNLADGVLERVAVEIPDETWSVKQIDDYLKRLEFFRVRLVGLRAARVEFERAHRDSVLNSRKGVR